MTVRELIELLKKAPPDDIVLADICPSAEKVGGHKQTN